MQCFAGYYDIKYGHLLEGEKQMGIIINTCKEFNLHPLPKGYLVIRATPPSRLGINLKNLLQHGEINIKIPNHEGGV